MQINTALNKTGSILSLLRVIVNLIMLTFFTKRCKLRFARKRKSECVFTEQRKRGLRFKLDVNIRVPLDSALLTHSTAPRLQD